MHKYPGSGSIFTISHSLAIVTIAIYRKNSNNRTVCYVVGVASSGKVWDFFVFLWPPEGLSNWFFAVFFAPILE